jgi:hypothetical protein
MLFKRRVHGIELLDNPRCPRAVRDGAHDYLQFIMRKGNAYAPVVAPLARMLVERNVTHIVDCCSGGGGPWPDLRNALVRAGASPDLDVVLTDAFPNTDAFAEIASRDPHVAGELVAVDIERGGNSTRRGTRTLFSSFHHFRADAAERVVRNLAQHHDEIFIAEVTERSARALLFMLLSPLLVWLATPALRPFRLSRLFLTYLVPVIPFVVCFDGIASCLRTYSVRELNELFTTLNDLPYDWEIARVPGNAPMAMTYVRGTPRTLVG